MTAMTVNAKVGKDGKVYAAEVDLGSNLTEAVKLFGDEVVFSNFKAHATVAAQSAMRTLINNSKNQAAITKEMAEWKPGIRKAAKSAVEKIRDKAKNLTPEQRAELLAALNE